MPRPNPPRKRPRRRPEAARADAELTKQTAQSSQKQPAPSRPAASGGGGGAAVAAAAPDEELWSRRSYAILIALVAGTEVFIGILLWALAPNPKDTLSLVAEVLGLQPYQPFPLLAACLLAAPVARRLTREARPLRFVESLIVGVVIYLLFVLLATAAGFALTGGAGSSSGSPVATPCPSGASCPSPSATARPTPTPSASTSPGASPSPNALGTPGSTIPESEVVAAAGVSMALAYAMAVFVYPPLYKRLRVKRPPPGTGPAGRGARDQRAKKDAPKR